ncbi:DUF2975 domain-containing protein [Neobacillus sp. Marseille-QA0830]
MKRGSILTLKSAIFIIGMIVLAFCLFLPGLAEKAAELNPEYGYLQIPVLVGIFLTAVPFYFALVQAFKLLRYIEADDAFSEPAVQSLGKIKNSAIVILILYVIGMVFLSFLNALHPGIAIMGFVIVFVSLVIALFTAILQELVRNVLKYKIENDLTV